MANRKGLYNVSPAVNNIAELQSQIMFTEQNRNISPQYFNISDSLNRSHSQIGHGERDAVKVKRTRRKPRRKKNQKDDEANTSLHSLSSNSSTNSSIIKSRLFHASGKKGKYCKPYERKDSSTSKTTDSTSLSNGLEQLQIQFSSFSLKPVYNYKNYEFIRKRTNVSHINLKSFVNKVSPRFISESKVFVNTEKTIQEPIDAEPRKRQKRERFRTKKSKEDVKFPEYLSEDEVKQGLSDGNLIKGFIRVNQKNFRESYVSNDDTSILDYFITSVTDRNRALDGDEVVLKIRPENEWVADSKTARVVSIAQKIHNRIAVGTLKPKDTDFALFVPRDKRFPIMQISQLDWPNDFKEKPELFENILFVAKLLEWATPDCAKGIILEKLGQSGDLKIETISILKEFNLDIKPFSEEMLENMPQFKEIPQSEYEYREDFRKKCVFTIDPATARDLDDALSVEILSNGNYEIGVHISDASFYLEEGTELDQAVVKKATSIYLVEKVYHMLPQEMCIGCSLLPGEDKLTFSVIWEITPQGEILKERFTRSLINSCVKLAYEHAQTVIDNPSKEFTEADFPQIYNGFEPKDIVRTINILQSIALILRENRFKNGALRIDNLKLIFSLDPNSGLPLDYSAYENKESHRLIEEFMLMANISVAKKIHEDFPKMAFLRRHEPPKQTMLVNLGRRLATYGIHLDTTSAGSIASSLKKYVSQDYTGYSRSVALNHLTSKAMTRAIYFCSASVDSDSEFKHYALSVPIYTHFTSPIRRYADIMVHRLLAASLNYRSCPEWDTQYIESIANNCNIQKYQAKKAGDASIELYLAHYVDLNQPFIQSCVVVDVKKTKFDVVVLKTGTVVRIYPNSCEKGTKWKHDENRLTITFPRRKRLEPYSMIIEIFSLVMIQLKKKDSYHLEGTLVRPQQERKKKNQQGFDDDTTNWNES